MDINITISDNLYKDLVKLSQMTRIDINTLIENRIREYVSCYSDKINHDAVKSAYVIEHGQKIPCEVIEKYSIMGQPYYRIFKSDTIMSVPVKNVHLK